MYLKYLKHKDTQYITQYREIGNWSLKMVIVWDKKKEHAENSLSNTGKYNFFEKSWAKK